MFDAAQHEPRGGVFSGGEAGAGVAAETQRWFEFDPTPIVLASFDKRILQVNPAGARAFAEVATLTDGRLGFADASARRAFDEALAVVAARTTDRVSTILRCDDGFWRRITIVRCGAQHAGAVFVILHGSNSADPDIAALAAAFGFTPTEARILGMLARGATPKAIAAQLGISPNTVRAHLRSLYGKTHVRGLYDLVREYTRLTT